MKTVDVVTHVLERLWSLAESLHSYPEAKREFIMRAEELLHLYSKAVKS